MEPKVHYRIHNKLSLSWSMQFVPPHPTSSRTILILFCHLQLGLPHGLFLSGAPPKPPNTLITFCNVHLSTNCAPGELNGTATSRVQHAKMQKPLNVMLSVWVPSSEDMWSSQQWLKGKGVSRAQRACYLRPRCIGTVRSRTKLQSKLSLCVPWGYIGGREA